MSHDSVVALLVAQQVKTTSTFPLSFVTNDHDDLIASQRRELVVDIAREAGALVRERFGHPGRVVSKPVSEGGSHIGDVVTEIDYASEALIRARVAADAPGSLVLGEEGGLLEASAGQSETDESPEAAADVWVVDPIDGTVNYAHGIPGFCVSIGCYRNGVPLAGAVYDPMLDEMFSYGGSDDNGDRAWCNADAIRVGHRAELAESMLGAGGGGPEFRNIVRQFRSWRRIGSAALSMAWVAAGRFDAYVQMIALSPWDYAAGVPLIQAAGGIVTTQHLTEWQHPLTGTSGMVAAAPAVHAHLAEMIAPHITTG